MAESADGSATPTGGGGKKGSNKLMRWIKQNKTLAAVLGIGGGYFLWKELSKGEGVEEVEGIEAPSGSAYGPSTQETVDTHEALDQEIGRVENEVREEREDRERIEAENGGQEGGEQESAPGSGEQEASSSGNESTPSTESNGGQVGITIHGKFFAGATGSHIAKTGQTEGNKRYIEYNITFPGRQEHWQYFTATGNWRQVNNSGAGPASGKPGSPAPGGGGGNKPGGGPVKAPSSVAPAGAKNPNHPNAISTGNPCVNGGVGAHTAPNGYHLFCENGTIWRAADQTKVGPGRPVGSPSPAPAPSPSPAPPPNHGDPQHPNAVPTGNACVNGGIGKHTAPPGYHLYCGPGNQIFRAPN